MASGAGWDWVCSRGGLYTKIQTPIRSGHHPCLSPRSFPRHPSWSIPHTPASCIPSLRLFTRSCITYTACPYLCIHALVHLSLSACQSLTRSYLPHPHIHTLMHPYSHTSMHSYTRARVRTCVHVLCPSSFLLPHLSPRAVSDRRPCWGYPIVTHRIAGTVAGSRSNTRARWGPHPSRCNLQCV